MKISIITITFNSEKTVEDTIKSVVSQDFPNVEYLIIDGLSKDKTLQVVNKYSAYIDKVVSEKDKGLYDALNKGIKHATGEVIGMLHSDDVYANNQVLSKVAQQFAIDPTLEAVYADLVFVDRENTDKVLRTWKSGAYKEDAFKQGWMPPHPTFFVKKSVYDRLGGFNLDLKLSADYELMLRFIHKEKIKIAYLPEIIVKMRMGGISNTSFFVKLKANMEDKLAWKLNGVKPGWFTTIRKPLKKLSQYFVKS
ncbi:MAG: glycosyltransferase [Bacteroidia bacterium]|nr:glycosyltransferase [Bacteroidota bacterium]MBP9081477.1 glycosyltransferase [Bacteroidia bacterium]MBK8414790.1 glycosyltransferase [Bacteroidota bacterium]MBK8872928.1 glycosyltransferase [Bacteroidota bacterium]MBK9422949.1 glycosyltransferase [Bacteroidota bacterium]